MAQLGFAANQYDPTDDFAPLPPAEYMAMITEGNLQYTQKGGKMVSFTYTIMDGQYQGRKLWSNHNIVNSSPKAEEIGRKEISRIAHAIGNPNANDTDHFINAVLLVKVVTVKDPMYGEKSEIKGWHAHGQVQQQPAAQQPASQSAAPAQTAPAQEQPPHPATKADAPPWGQR